MCEHYLLVENNPCPDPKLMKSALETKIWFLSLYFSMFTAISGQQFVEVGLGQSLEGHPFVEWIVNQFISLMTWSCQVNY